jgi:hypothetical protein
MNPEPDMPTPESQRKKISNDLETAKQRPMPSPPSNMSPEEYARRLAAEAKQTWDEFIAATDGAAKLKKRAAEAKAAKEKPEPLHKQISTGWDEAATDAGTWMNEPMNRNLYRQKPPLDPGRKAEKERFPVWDEQSKWEAVVLVWNDCQTLDYDEEDTGEMLYGVVASIMDGSYEPPD